MIPTELNAALNLLLFTLLSSSVRNSLTANKKVRETTMPPPSEKKIVHICGTFPNRYLSYEPCPGGTEQDLGSLKQSCPKGGHKLGLKCRHNSDCPLYADYKTECYKGECCTKEAGGIDLTPYDKELCKNGGYFVSSPCQTLEDCRRNLEHHNERERWTRYKQVCYENECCTESKEQEPVNTSSFESAEDQIVGCKALGGYHLNRSCRNHKDCNRILRLSQNEQIECLDDRCCILPRRLPKGFSNWQEICPSGGEYRGKLCHNDNDCGTIGEICESNHCCEDQRENPRVKLDDEGSYSCNHPSDLLTDLKCYSDQECQNFNVHNGYCSYRVGFCCRKGQQDVCINGGRWLRSYCNQDSDCPSSSYGKVRCFEGLCCASTGVKISDNPNDEILETGLEDYAYCYNGQRSKTNCALEIQCLPTESCVNGVCCRRTGEEWKSVCGGTLAVSNCFGEHGQAVSKCGRGCPTGYFCENNFCCPRCQRGNPYGSCFNELCPRGYKCQAGNICCPE